MVPAIQGIVGTEFYLGVSMKFKLIILAALMPVMFISAIASAEDACPYPNSSTPPDELQAIASCNADRKQMEAQREEERQNMQKAKKDHQAQGYWSQLAGQAMHSMTGGLY